MKMAAMAQVLNHRNSSHATDSFLRFNKLRREGILCDLTILVEGEKFKAHKVVLAACSDYFFTAICGGKSTASVSVSDSATGSHMTIELQYVTRKGFVPLLEYAYTSDLNVNAADVIDVLSAASYMQMFDVATACSEFMRSNLLWTQSQSHLAGLPLVPGRRHIVANAQHSNDHGSSSPAHGRYNGLPEAVNNLLQATSVMSSNATAGVPAIGRPPVLIPISSMNPYNVNFRQWADSMNAGTHNLISQIVNGQSNKAMSSPPSSLSPVSPPQPPVMASRCNERRRSSLQPQSGLERLDTYGLARSEGGSPVTKENGFETQEERDRATNEVQYHSPSNSNNNNNNNMSIEETSDKLNDGMNNRKSVAVKVEMSDVEINSRPVQLTDEQGRSNPPEDAEDSWQSLQKLYSFRNGETIVPSPSKSFVPGDHENLSGLLKTTMAPALLSRIATSTNGLKMVMEKYKDGISKPDTSLPMVPALNGMSMQQAILHHQRQLLAQQQQQHQQLQQSPQRSKDPEKITPELPAVPPSGQYMSVRRRTLQSNVPKPHQCQICGSRFTRYHNLKQHIKLHSGVKPYECDECGKKFTRNYTLRLHKMKHVGLRNYRCGTCNAAFTSVGEFRAHLRITMHSHPLANGSSDSPQIQDRVPEPEDLSNGLPRNAIKFGQFDYSLLNYGVGSPGSSGGGAAGEGSTGTISPPGNVNPSSLLFPGINSPQLSDRSLSGSPQDLSRKRSLSDVEDKISGENDSDYCRLSPKTTDHEMQLGEEVNKRGRLSRESPFPYKSENEYEAKTLRAEE